MVYLKPETFSETDNLCQRVETRRQVHQFNYLYIQSLNISCHDLHLANPAATILLSRILLLIAALFSFIDMTIVQAVQITKRAVTTLIFSVWERYIEVFLF